MMSEPVAGVKTLAVVLNKDLLFGSRIRDALVGLGLESRFVPDTERFVTALATEGPGIAIGIVDMNGTIDWRRLSAVLTAAARRPSLQNQRGCALGRTTSSLRRCSTPSILISSVSEMGPCVRGSISARNSPFPRASGVIGCSAPS